MFNFQIKILIIQNTSNNYIYSNFLYIFNLGKDMVTIVANFQNNWIKMDEIAKNLTLEIENFEIIYN